MEFVRIHECTNENIVENIALRRRTNAVITFYNLYELSFQTSFRLFFLPPFSRKKNVQSYKITRILYRDRFTDFETEDFEETAISVLTCEFFKFFILSHLKN